MKNQLSIFCALVFSSLMLNAQSKNEFQTGLKSSWGDRAYFKVKDFKDESTSQNDDNKWVRKADFGGGKIYDPAIFIIGNYAYVATGSNDAFYGYGLQKFMYRYDPSLDVWEMMADLPPTATARFRAVGFAVGEKGYVCGGTNDATLWEYNPATDLWYQRINFPRVIEEGMGFTISSKAYVGLGGASIIDYKNDFYEYDPSKNKWTKLKDFPGAPRRGSVGFSLNGKGYAGLGYKDIGSYNKGYFKDLWEYDPLTDSWIRLPDFPGEARQSAIGFGVEGALYVGMGGINDFYKYDLKTKEWSSLNYIPGSSRIYAFSFCIGSNIYYGGGMSPNITSDMWKYSIASVSELSSLKMKDFKCLPNPVIDILKIEIPEEHRIVEIKLTDISGKVIVVHNNNHSIITNKTLNLSSFRNGYYIITLEDQVGNLFTKKLLKSK